MGLRAPRSSPGLGESAAPETCHHCNGFQQVAAGDPLVVLEAMKMETIVSAEGDARVKEVHVTTGAMIEPGQVLIVLEFA